MTPEGDSKDNFAPKNIGEINPQDYSGVKHAEYHELYTGTGYNGEEWEKEFDFKTDAGNFKPGKLYTLLGEHLFDPDWYPESPYELDRDKVKAFIRTLINKHKVELFTKLLLVPIFEKAHTYSSESADIYRAYEAGEKSMKLLILKIVQEHWELQDKREVWDLEAH